MAARPPSPLRPQDARARLGGYAESLRSLTPAQLRAELTRVNEALEREARSSVTDLLREYSRSQDTLGPPSTPTVDPSPTTERGA